MLPKYLGKLKKVNEIIRTLQKRGELSQYVILKGRTKSQLSAQTKASKKTTLNDVLGIEIVVASEKELETILNYINIYFTTFDSDKYDVTTKKIKKQNGYEATHVRYQLAIWHIKVKLKKK